MRREGHTWEDDRDVIRVGQFVELTARQEWSQWPLSSGEGIPLEWRTKTTPEGDIHGGHEARDDLIPKIEALLQRVDVKHRQHGSAAHQCVDVWTMRPPSCVCLLRMEEAELMGKIPKIPKKGGVGTSRSQRE